MSGNSIGNSYIAEVGPSTVEPSIPSRASSAPSRGRFSTFELPGLRQNRRLAHRLIRAGLVRAGQRNAHDGIIFVERAIEYDQAGALEEGYYEARWLLYKGLGVHGPIRAIGQYHEGIRLAKAGLFDQARSSYHEAIRLDPKCLWAQNNLAWLLATCPDQNYRHGPASWFYARALCQQSRWSYWGFLDTLAAALACCGERANALAVLQQAIALAPPERQAELVQKLERYIVGNTADVPGQPIAAGGAVEVPEGVTIQ